MLANVVINQANKELKNYLLPWSRDNDIRLKLTEIEQLIDKLINELRTSEDRTQYHEALVLRGSTRALLGKYMEAIEDCKLVLYENPKHPDALWNGGLAAMQIGEIETAISLLSKLDPGKTEKNVVLTLSTAYLFQGAFKNAVNLLTDPEIEFLGQDKIRQLRLLAEGLFNLGETESARATADELLAMYPDSPMALDAVASIDGHYLAEIHMAEKHYRQAHEISMGEEQKFHALKLADFYFFQNKPGNAVPLYEEAGIPDVDCPETQRYLIALLNSGDLGKAYHLAQKLRSDGPAIAIISEIEAKIAYYIDDLQNARRLFAELIEIDPNYLEHYLLAAETDIRRGDFEQACDLLVPAIELFNDDSIALMSIAQLLQAADYPMQQVLDLAYHACRLGVRIAQVQSAYLGVFLQTEKESEIFNPNQVDVDTAVRIDIDGEDKWYVILDIDYQDRSLGQLVPNDALAQRLIGSKLGDRVNIAEHPIHTITGVIVEIQSKYVRAFQEIIVNFNTNFPDELGPIKFPFPIEDPERIVTLPNIGVEHLARVLDTYLNKNIPITLGSVSKARRQISC